MTTQERKLLTDIQASQYKEFINLMHSYVPVLKKYRWSVLSKEDNHARQVIIELEDTLLNYFSNFRKLENTLEDRSSDVITQDFRAIKEHLQTFVTRGIRTLLAELYPEFKQKPKKIKRQKKEMLFSGINRSPEPLSPSEIAGLVNNVGHASEYPQGYMAQTNTGRLAQVYSKIIGGKLHKVWRLADASLVTKPTPVAPKYVLSPDNTIG